MLRGIEIPKSKEPKRANKPDPMGKKTPTQSKKSEPKGKKTPTQSKKSEQKVKKTPTQSEKSETQVKQTVIGQVESKESVVQNKPEMTMPEREIIPSKVANNNERDFEEKPVEATVRSIEPVSPKVTKDEFTVKHKLSKKKERNSSKKSKDPIEHVTSDPREDEKPQEEEIPASPENHQTYWLPLDPAINKLSHLAGYLEMDRDLETGALSRPSVINLPDDESVYIEPRVAANGTHDLIRLAFAHIDKELSECLAMMNLEQITNDADLIDFLRDELFFDVVLSSESRKPQNGEKYWIFRTKTTNITPKNIVPSAIEAAIANSSADITSSKDWVEKAFNSRIRYEPIWVITSQNVHVLSERPVIIPHDLDFKDDAYVCLMRM